MPLQFESGWRSEPSVSIEKLTFCLPFQEPTHQEVVMAGVESQSALGWTEGTWYIASISPSPSSCSVG